MLDTELAAFLEQGRASGAPDLCELPPNAARGLYRVLTAAADRPPAAVESDSRHIAGPENHLALRVYRPAAGPAAGVALYLHGGGFVVGDLECYHGVCSNLCASADCTVVAVDYRLAPEHPFPAAVDDCYAALEWVAAGLGSEFGADDRIAVVGDSAGGNLSAVMTLLARERQGPEIAFQGLVYPVTAATPGLFPSHGKFGSGYVLTSRSIEYFTRHYFAGTLTAPDYRGAPLLANDLAGLPPALIQVAGFDPLRDEGVAYAERLRAAGVAVELEEYPGLSHGYINMTGRIGAAAAAFGSLGAHLRRFLG